MTAPVKPITIEETSDPGSGRGLMVGLVPDLCDAVIAVDDGEVPQPGPEGVEEVAPPRHGPVVAVQVHHHQEEGREHYGPVLESGERIKTQKF